MVLGIDASNLTEYGGLNHLLSILSYPEIIKKYGFKKVIIWCDVKIINLIYKDELYKIVCIKNNNLFKRLLWQRYNLSLQAEKECDIIFAPGGVYISKYKPYVVMCQNMLVFDNSQLTNEGYTFLRLKTILLKYFQSFSFKNSDGLIFLSEYAKDYLYNYYNKIVSKTENTIIPHGINKAKLNVKLKTHYEHTNKRSLNILYVSSVKSYKHHTDLINGFQILLEKGYNIKLNLVGGGDKIFIRKMKNSMRLINDKYGEKVFYHGKIDFDKMNIYYEKADIFVYPSSCENLPLIILESMSYGIPIACSNLRPMTDILGDSALYFNHNDIDSIAQRIEELVSNIEYRKNTSLELYAKSMNYSWELCVDRTFSYLSKIAKKYYSKEIL